MTADRDATIEQAKSTLDGNWTGRNTIPAYGLYPHQWNWDTGFIAIGRSLFGQERAEKELLSLFEGQWKTGMVPHIVFNPNVPSDDYFPGPSFWQSEKVPDSPKLPTSGITQPPVHAFSALEAHRRAKDVDRSTAFLRKLYPGLVALHDYLRTQRSVGDEGLACIIHPWESGMDNSPAWDEAMERVDIPPGALPKYQRRDLAKADPRDRPTNAAYDRFVYLAMRYRDVGYSYRKAMEVSPFMVEDPMFNAIWAWSSHALSDIAEIIGEDGLRFREDGDRVTAAIGTKLWGEDHGRFFPFDLRDVTQMNHHSIVSFAPLIAPGLDSEKARRTVQTMREIKHCKQTPCYILPSYEPRDGDFNPRQYWRGPIWINTDWLLYRGCRLIGERSTADELRKAILELVEKIGFREYFDVHGDAGYGADKFSWTAALYLDVALGA